MVDDYQDTTFAAERFLAEIRPRSFVVGRRPRCAPVLVPGNHLTNPFRRFVERNPGVQLGRARDAASSRARVDRGLGGPDTSSEQHAGGARELRRLHVDDGVAWREPRGGRPAPRATRRSAPRARRRARPTARSPTWVRSAAVPATRPFVLALRWLVADPQERDALIEAGPDLRASAGCRRRRSERCCASRARDSRPPREALALHGPRRTRGRGSAASARGRPRNAAEAVHASCSLDAFRVLWLGAPCSQPTCVERAETDHHALVDLDAVVEPRTPSRSAGTAADPSTEAFLLSLGAAEGAPTLAAGDESSHDEVQVLTAHAAAGRGVRHGHRARRARGRLPEPVPARADVRSRDARGRDRAFLRSTGDGSPTSAACSGWPACARGRRVVLTATGSARRRVLGDADLAVRRGARSAVARRSGRAVRGAGVDVRGVPRRGGAGSATRTRAGGRAARGPDGLLALGDDPAAWWFQREWTDLSAVVEDALSLSYSRLSTLENCELQFVLSSELGLDPRGGYQAWVRQARALDHRGGASAARSSARPRRSERAPDERWEKTRFPSYAISGGRARERQDGPDPELVRTLRRSRRRRRPSAGSRSSSRAPDPRQDRPDRPSARGRHADHRLQDRAFGQRAQARRGACSSASTTWRSTRTTSWPSTGRCRRSSSRSSAGRRRIPRSTSRRGRSREDVEEDYMARMRDRLTELIRSHPRAQRRAPVRREHEGELLLLPVPDALHAATRRAARCSRSSRPRPRRSRSWPAHDRAVTRRPIGRLPARGEPTPEQWTAISWPARTLRRRGRRRIGKTSVMAARVIYLAMVATGPGRPDHEGVMPGNVLCLTFTNNGHREPDPQDAHGARTLELDEGEEPEISNYHAFAAQVLERHGMLIGLEPGQRVLSQAQRARDRGPGARPDDVRDACTRGGSPRSSADILDLDQQLQNHLVEPETVIEHVEGKLGRARQGEVGGALRGRAGADRDRPRGSGVPRPEGGARRDRLRRPDRARGPHRVGPPGGGQGLPRAVRGRAARRVPGHEPRPGGADAGRVRRRPSGDGGRRPGPEHLRAWRGASLWNLLHFRAEFLLPDGNESAQLPLYTNFRSGARILEAADRVIDALPANQRPDPDKLLRAVGPQRRGTRRGRPLRARDRGGGGRRRARARAPRRGRRLARHGRPVPDPPAVRGAATGVRRDGGAGGVREPRGADPPPRDRRGARLRARDRGPARRRRARADPDRAPVSRRAARPRGPGRVVPDQRRRAPQAAGRPGARRGRRPAGGPPVPRWPRRSNAWTRSRDSPTRAAFGWPSSAATSSRRAPRGGAATGRRVPSPRSSAGPGLLAELDSAADQPMALARRRNLAAFLEQVHAFQPVDGELTLRGVPRASGLDRRRPRVEPGPAERRRLGEGDDGARGQGTRVRGGVRPGARPRPVP